MRTSAGLVYLLACLLEPFIPSFSLEVLKQFNIPQNQVSLSDENGDLEKAEKPWELLPAGHKIGEPQPLFKEMKDEERGSYRLSFAGSQAERAIKAAVDKEAEKLKKMTFQVSLAVSPSGGCIDAGHFLAFIASLLHLSYHILFGLHLERAFLLMI